MDDDTLPISEHQQPDGTVIAGPTGDTGPTPAGDPAPSAEAGSTDRLLEDLRVVFDRQTAAGTSPIDGPDELIGQQIDRYLVKKLLGEGGMARVYLAVDTQSDSKVAMKTLKPQYRADHNMSTRFEREARSMSRLQHEHVVRVLDFPSHGPGRAIVMEYAPGGSLRDRLMAAKSTRRPIPIDEAVDLVRQAAAGCAAAHAIGIVHRDLKPSNLLFDTDGRIKVADFGTIMVVEGTTWLTGVGQQIGTPGYMSPEQCRGERVTAASDVYSLGVTLFELLTSQLPFEVEEASPFAMMLKHISEPIPDPRTLRSDVPDGLATVVFRCLAKHPGDRYPNAGDLAQALLDYPRAAARTAEAATPHEHGWRVDVAAVKKQLQVLPQRAIVCWACRCARRVQHLRDPDPRVERALAMAEAVYHEEDEPESPHSASRALSRIRNLRAASLKAAYVEDGVYPTQAAMEATRAAAAAAASAAALCVADTAADAAFAARSALAALKLASEPVKPFWEAALNDYHKLVNARLGREGTMGKAVPRDLFPD
ncbi:MAG: serine/threonine protein kinase [Planctomycetes bacterium]|nr:serine/threonine protein kinase [Planctomycetota bacterium]